MSQIFVGCFWVLVLLIVLFGVVIFLYCGFSKFGCFFFFLLSFYRISSRCFVSLLFMSFHVMSLVAPSLIGLGYSDFLFCLFVLFLLV